VQNQLLFRIVLASSIFTGAFLLFFIQPLIARQLLPNFGGAASVWLACLLMFQTLLLLGYCYAHLLRVYFAPRLQCLVHFLLLGLSLPWTWFNWSVTGPGISLSTPLLSLAAELMMGIGVPFLLVSATVPWYRTGTG